MRYIAIPLFIILTLLCLYKVLKDNDKTVKDIYYDLSFGYVTIFCFVVSMFIAIDFVLDNW